MTLRGLDVDDAVAKVFLFLVESRVEQLGAVLSDDAQEASLSAVLAAAATCVALRAAQVPPPRDEIVAALCLRVERAIAAAVDASFRSGRISVPSCRLLTVLADLSGPAACQAALKSATDLAFISPLRTLEERVAAVAAARRMSDEAVDAIGRDVFAGIVVALAANARRLAQAIDSRRDLLQPVADSFASAVARFVSIFSAERRLEGAPPEGLSACDELVEEVLPQLQLSPERSRRLLSTFVKPLTSSAR